MHLCACIRHFAEHVCQQFIHKIQAALTCDVPFGFKRETKHLKPQTILFLFLSTLVEDVQCAFVFRFVFLLFFSSSLANNSETGAVMSVLEALAVSS